MRHPSEEDRATAFERAIGPQAGRTGNGGGRLFSGGACRAFPSRNKIAGLCHPPLALRPSACAPGAGPSRPGAVVATKAAMVAVQPTEHPMNAHDDDEPNHSASPTDHVLQELQLYGWRPSEGEARSARRPGGSRHRRRRRRHLRRPHRHPGRHPPRPRPRRTALVERQHVPPRRRADRAQARRQRAGPEAPPARTGWHRGQVGRARTPDRERRDSARAARQPGALPRPRRRPLSPHHRITLVAAHGLDGQPPPPDRRDDRQSRLPRRQTPRRGRGAGARRAEDRLHRRSTPTTTG